MKKLDGILIRDEILDEIREQVDDLNRKPVLLIIQVGNDKASNTYIRNKISACKRANIEVVHMTFDEKASQSSVINTILGANKDDSVDGIIVQLPLPKHIDPSKVEQAIHPLKDVDGFTINNKGALFVKGMNRLEACTPAGAIELLKRNDIELEGKHCVIANRSNIIGKPLMHMLLEENATVSVIHSQTPNNISNLLLSVADVVFLGTGRARAYKPTQFKEGAVVVDFSINFDENGRMCGDLDTTDDKELDNLLAYTPVPGGCGPMTITMLLNNVLRAYKLNNQK